ncbi:MAG: ribonuclease R [Bauldia sp.]|uniref:ribonuclease R n=1 Tax=Bauldia sp. TaxID=2575872 RepID=UPI001D998931|nr:ribonuclease R [Bauldia sp.]MCB1496706.1 ribonuclease R [Bauldia sp.]
MAKKSTGRKTTTKRPFPTREEILAFIADNPGNAGKREISRAFGIKGADRIPLKALLKELAEDGVVEKRRGKLNRSGDLPSVTVLQVTGRDADGDLVAEPAEWLEEQGSAPRILVLPNRGKAKGPTAGVGDRILARLSKDGAGGGFAYAARVIKVLAARPATVLGVYREGPGGPQLEPVDRKQKVLPIDPDGAGDIKEGDLVTVTVSRSGRYGQDRARIAEVIGSMRNEKAVSLIALLSHGIPHVFPKEVLAEADAAKPVTPKGREDWRDLPLVTIDPADAKDHDDAVCAVADADPDNKGGFIVTVAIADVATYVTPGSAMDREALKRGNSVYFPDRVVPMLPERISNDLCSLREGEDRPALAVRMVFTADGRKRGHTFHRVMMRSAAKLPYPVAQKAFDGEAIDADRRVLDALKTLWQAYEALRRGRDDRSPLELDLPERRLVLGKDGSIERVIVPERLESMRLIEEFMIQANVAAAETLEAKRSPLVYRIHDTPSLAKLEALRDFLKSVDMTFPKGGNLRPSHFNQILARARGGEHDQLLQEVVLRTQSQAEYHPENIGHFGLNLRRYAHFTSPIRRYADLIVHRALIGALKLGAGGLPKGIETELPEIAAQISAAERRAMAAERDTIDRLVAHWLADRVGASFHGRIAGVTRAGLFVKLDETGADGFVPMRSLGNDYFVYDEARRAVTGQATGETHRLGDSVEVKLIEAAPLAGALRFELLSEGRILPKKERPSAGRKPARGKAGKARSRARKGPGKASRKRR